MVGSVQVLMGAEHRAHLDIVAFGRGTLRNTHCSLKVWFALVSPKKEKWLFNFIKLRALLLVMSVTEKVGRSMGLWHVVIHH